MIASHPNGARIGPEADTGRAVAEKAGTKPWLEAVTPELDRL